VDGADRHDQSRDSFDAREGGSFRISLTYDPRLAGVAVGILSYPKCKIWV